MSTPDFDWQGVPLSGTQLIEASAGTGKTWALTALYLRLLLETELQPDNILVVTFTKAATAELKERLRSRLLQAWEILHGVKPANDIFARHLVARYAHDAYLVRKLNMALRHFDRAAIYTIHGFCQRVLSDHAFNTGAAFGLDLDPDDTPLIRRLIEDFWLQHIAPSQGLWPLFLYTQRITPQTWLMDICELSGKAEYSRQLVPAAIDLAAPEQAFTRAYGCAREYWLSDAAQITGSVLACKLGYRSTGFNKLNQLFLSEEVHLDWYARDGSLIAERFGAQYLARIAQEKNKPAPVHPFFTAMDTLIAAFHTVWQALKVKEAHTLSALLRYCTQELPSVKRQSGTLAYNDLLSQLDEALQRDQEGKLAALLHNRFAAALIDEFQDTDPVQYRIFSRIYQTTSCPVFLIGDPKQAIYSFRGADVYTYLCARKETTAQWTLRVNHRSHPSMITSINSLFSRLPAAFWLPQITYVNVTQSLRELPEFVDPEYTEALHCWRLEAREESRLSKEDAALRAISATAVEIQRLLQQARIGGVPVKPGDIAILVPSHHYAAQTLKHLTAVGIPAVRQGMDNVLTSGDAYEWLRIMQAFLEPQSEALRKSALTTFYMGVDGHELLRLIADEPRWDAVTLQFMQYHTLWQRHGITRAFRAWLSDWQVAPRLMREPDGERRLTNLLHLVDIIQVKSQVLAHLAMLTDWFARETVAPGVEEDIAQLRLESDADRVRVVTIHAAKGLEYPIVFCPFLWHANSRHETRGTIVFHNNSGQSYLDFGSEAQDQHRQQAQEEQFAERLRVLYVALTRARYRNYIAWGPVNGVEGAALSWLLYGAGEQTLAQFMHTVKMLTGESWWAPWQHARETVVRPLPVPGHSVSVSDAPARALTRAVFSRVTLPSERIMTSFSALTQGQYSERPDYDADQITVSVQENLEGIAAFPAGARAGLCWHHILELWDFQPGAHLIALVADKLKAYGFSPEWEAPVNEMFARLSEVRFAGIALSMLAPSQRISEMAFTFRLAPVGYSRLAQVLEDAGEKDWALASKTLRFETVKGMMTGFIDLVIEADGQYFVIDYKSNRLGSNDAAYHPYALRHAMATHHYYLQYLIYSVALHRYLRSRLPGYDYDRHFGGIAYIFMRGLGDDKSSGIFRDRPDRQLIEALDTLFEP